MQQNETIFQIKEVSKMAGISARTLHYYDEIGLLSPTEIGLNGYRYYDETALLKLQQILFYKSFGFKLATIQNILTAQDFDPISALETHKETLLKEYERLERLITTIDHTVEHLKGERFMAKEEFFEGYDPGKQTEYEEEIREKYGEDSLKQSQQRWGSYSKAKQEQVLKEGKQITQNIADNMAKGFDHSDVQHWIKAWHNHMANFYDCSLEVFEGLGHMYNEDPRFHKSFTAFHADLPRFMQQAMSYYVEQTREK